MNQNEQYHRAFDALRSAGIVALPTDTIYGLVAVASDEGAVARLLDIKARPESKPLPLFVASIEQAELIATFTEPARLLAERFWPGALTLVLDRRPGFVTAAAPGKTIGVRAPDDPVIREMAAQLGPLTGTSANRAGAPETRTAEEVRAQLGAAVDVVVDAPLAADGVASTVVDCTDSSTVRVIREGAVSRRVLVNVLAGLADVI